LKKKEVEKILENLFNQGKLIKKEYMQKIYLINQNNFPKISDKDILEIDKKEENTKEILSKTVEKLTKLQTEYKNFGKDLNNQELESLLELKRKKVDQLMKNLSKYEESGIENVPLEKMTEAEKIYEKNIFNYKKLKSAAMNIIENLSESLEVNSKTFMCSLGFEGEDNYIKKLKMKLNSGENIANKN
jgi:delta-aminolevulinic acid dehydratase/porphobilinogen synthase